MKNDFGSLEVTKRNHPKFLVRRKALRAIIKLIFFALTFSSIVRICGGGRPCNQEKERPRNQEKERVTEERVTEERVSEAEFVRDQTMYSEVLFSYPRRDESWSVQPRISTLTISIVSNNRFHSLKRLLDSICKAEYFFSGADFFSSIEIIFNLEASTSTEILDFVRDFEWPHGRKFVRKRIQKGGLIRAVSESWFPASKNDYGLILEDDIEVSKFYLMWIIKVMWNLFRNPDTNLVGISLYSPRVTETTSELRVFNSNEMTQKIYGDPEIPYLLQTPCSWGAVYFPFYWAKFNQYMQLRLNNIDVENVEIPNSRTNGWKASWKKYFFELMYIDKTYLIYPNFMNQHSLSTNHMEVGEHIKPGDDAHKKIDFVVPLLEDQNSIISLNLPDWNRLPLFNLFGELYGTIRSLDRYLSYLAKNGEYEEKLFKPVRPGSDTLQLDQELRSDRGGSLLSIFGNKFQCVMQKDGNLVVYSIDKEIAIWDSGTSELVPGNERNCSAYTLHLTMKGCLQITCEKEKISSSGTMLSIDKEEIVWESPRNLSESCSRDYFARLEPDGTLSVYCGEQVICDTNSNSNSNYVVWKSKEFDRGNSENLVKCDEESEEVKYFCNSLPRNTQQFLRAEDSITLMISFYSRYEILLSQLKYYASSPLISSILVTWHNLNVQAPRTSRIGNTFIYFFAPMQNSLNNRFNPDIRVVTDCVLIIDDDMKVHLQDISNLFEVWKLNMHRIVGFSPRWYDIEENSKRKSTLIYRVESEDPPISSPGKSPRTGYGIMLTKSMMIHRDFLQVYTCGGYASTLRLNLSHRFEILRSTIRNKVTKSLNCEDIGMNFIISALLHEEGKDFSAALFLTPVHKLGDFGKVGKNSLHLKRTHEISRSECLNTFNEIFKSKTGQNLPLSTELVKSTIIDAKTTQLQYEQYYGHRNRIHEDCFSVSMNANSSDPCSFEQLVHTSFSTVWK